MARRKRKSNRRLLIVLAVLVLAGVALWFNRAQLLHWSGGLMHGKDAGNAAVADAGSGNHSAPLSGALHGSGPARDPQLGVSANAAVLFRHVEMYQWQEHCERDTCRYDTAWSGAVDSQRFRERRGHENPAAPFNDAVFFAPGLKLDALDVDTELLIAQLRAVNHDVRGASLPPNLAASFSETGGVLYAGGDPAHPAVGEVRISYRVIAAGPVTLNGFRRGDKLAAH